VIPVPWKMFTYSLEDYPFPTWVARSLEVDNLTSLTADLQLNTWQTDQTSPWHGPFYASFGRWQDAYVDFLRDVVAPRFGEPVYYQRVPTFRVHLPGNLAVGEFHTDAQYHHPEDEVSFWLPLTPAYDTCSLWVADDDDALRGVVARPGEVVEFSAAKRLHGNYVNQTGHSRVSFDFRCLPVRLLPDTEGPPTKHTGLRFVPGGYYAAEPIS